MTDRDSLVRLIAVTTLLLPALTPAATLGITDLSPGDLLITEYLADPLGSADTDGEYIEIYNRRSDAVDLAGLVVRDDGSNSLTLPSLLIDAGGFLVLGNGSGLGFTPDHIYGSAMALTNTSDEIVLAGADDVVLHSVAYADGDGFGDGVSHELRSARSPVLQALGPGLGDDFIAAIAALGASDFGSPGFAGQTLLPVQSVPLPATAWLFLSGLGAVLARQKIGRSSLAGGMRQKKS